VGSRNFGININGVKRTTMVPWADMLNHFRPRETSWTFDNSQQGFTMTSLKQLSSGQQIMDSYGKKCNR
jgi:histone-lysine N-methyltransferase SETD3